jgi:hypothetical protein
VTTAVVSIGLSMQMNGDFIFVGVKIKENLYNELEDSKASMKPYYQDNNPKYLQIIRIDDDEFIGKMVQSGASIDNLTNNLMNLKTMLKMIIPKFTIPDDTIKVYAHTPAPKRTIF